MSSHYIRTRCHACDKIVAGGVGLTEKSDYTLCPPCTDREDARVARQRAVALEQWKKNRTTRSTSTT